MADDEFHSHVRLSNAARSAMLCRLDEAAAGVGRDRRRCGRWSLGPSDLAMLVRHPAGGTGRYLVCPRNVSTGGLSAIHGGYLHPGSECRIMLPRRRGGPSAVDGVVTHCRHVEGSYHEIGIRFAHEVDPAALVTRRAADEAGELPPARGRVLVLDGSPADRRLLKRNLAATALAVTMVETSADAINAVRRHEYDLILCDLNVRDDALRMIRQVRVSNRYTGPIVVTTAESDADRLAEARAAGADEIIGKPHSAAYLATLLAEWLDASRGCEPIYSSLEETAGIAELVADFVGEVRWKTRQLEKLLDRGDVAGARTLCVELSGSGAGFGFPTISEAARDALTAIDTARDKQDAESSLKRLVTLCQRLRCGSSAGSGWKQSA